MKTNVLEDAPTRLPILLVSASRVMPPVHIATPAETVSKSAQNACRISHSSTCMVSLAWIHALSNTLPITSWVSASVALMVVISARKRIQRNAWCADQACFCSLMTLVRVHARTDTEPTSSKLVVIRRKKTRSSTSHALSWLPWQQ